jgi:DHA1 family multidrug resistance protein-like MFS transporter
MRKRRSLGLPSGASERRLVVALCVTTFLLWIGGSAILPLLPSYLRQHGSTPGLIGLVMASYFAASVLTQFPAGKLSDRVGRRPVLVVGLALFAVGSLGFALTAGPGFAIVSRGLQGIGAGAVTVASAATIGSVVEASERGGSFGALYGSQMAALAVGPLVGSLVGAASMRLLFVIGAVAALVAVLPTASFLPSGNPPGPRAPAPERDEVRVEELEALSAGAPGGLGLGGTTGNLVLTPAIVGVVLAFVATGGLVGVYEACWTLLLRLRGATTFDVGLSWTLFALPFAALSLPAGRLADRFDRRILALGGLVSSALFCAVYPFVHLVPLLVALGSLEAACSVVGAPAAVLILTEATRSEAQGQAQGAIETGRTAATAVSAAAAGALFAVDPIIPFTLAATVAVGACGFIAWSWRDVAARPGRARTENREVKT